jgi:hypothetical protein
MTPWLLTLIALYGAYLVSNQEKKGFYWWVVSNTGFAVYNASIGQIAMAVLFCAYLGITINGLRKWK